MEETSATTKPRQVQPGPLGGGRFRSEHPEFDLLAACCATSWCPEQVRQIDRLLGSEVDWKKLLRMAEHHGLTSVLLDRLLISSQLVPRDILDRFRSAYRLNVYRALWFGHELGRIVENLRSARVEVLAHKGPALSVILYGDVVQRQFRDLDFLVRQCDVNKVKAVLAGMGYECGVNLGPLEERAYLQVGYEHVFHSSHGQDLLEVQWRILPRFYAIDFDMQGLFARTQEIRVGNVVCGTLSNEDALLTLCVHAAKHVWTQMSWLRDITQLTRVHELDWEFVERQATRLGIQRILALNFLLTDHLFGCGFPGHFEKWLDHHPTQALMHELLGIMQQSVPYETESFAYFHRMMRLRERWRDRARFLWRLASTPGIREWQSVRLPRVLFPMYPLVRVGRLAKRLAFEP